MFNQQVEDLNLSKLPRVRQAYSELPPTHGISPDTQHTPVLLVQFLSEFTLHRASAEWTQAGWAEITVQAEPTQGLAVGQHLALT